MCDSLNTARMRTSETIPDDTQNASQCSLIKWKFQLGKSISFFVLLVKS
jgi:hypothetical protein